MTAITEALDEALASRGFVRQAALDKAFAAHAVGGWHAWPAARREVAGEQLIYRWAGIDVGTIDGLVGPQTEHARDAWVQLLATGALPSWRDQDPVETALPVMPAASRFPRQSAMAGFYGAPGPAIERQLVFVTCPWQLVIAWDTSQTTTRIRIHRQCAESLASVLDAQWRHYGADGIREIGAHLYGGSYAHRKMRGGSSWSTHAFGAAIDWDPARNALSTRAPTARLSQSDATTWWQIWEAAGWLSLGRARGYDWMHVQAATL